MRIEETAAWADPRSIRIDCEPLGETGAARMWGVDFPEIEVAGANVGLAAQAFLEALVAAHPEYGGTTRSLLIRFPEATV